MQEERSDQLLTTQLPKLRSALRAPGRAGWEHQLTPRARSSRGLPQSVHRATPMDVLLPQPRSRAGDSSGHSAAQCPAPALPRPRCLLRAALPVLVKTMAERSSAVPCALWSCKRSCAGRTSVGKGLLRRAERAGSRGTRTSAGSQHRPGPVPSRMPPTQADSRKCARWQLLARLRCCLAPTQQNGPLSPLPINTGSSVLCSSQGCSSLSF